MKILSFSIALILLTGIPAFAEPKGTLGGFFADYEDVKTRAVALLVEVDEARNGGYSSEVKPLIALSQEVLKLRRDMTDFYFIQEKQSLKQGSAPLERRVLIAMVEASKALANALEAELEYQAGSKTTFLMLVRAKYDDLFRMADEEVGAVRIELSPK